jgi:hypothetical protein
MTGRARRCRTPSGFRQAETCQPLNGIIDRTTTRASQIGITAPFWFNAFSNAGVIGALFWWHSPQGRNRRLPAERFFSSIRTGFRYARYNRHLRARVRGRGLAIFVTAFFGALSLGSAIWGQIAGLMGLSPALFAAAAGAIAAIPLTWHRKLQTAAGIDLTPSMHWPTPVLSHDGPVLVTVEYEIEPKKP